MSKPRAAWRQFEDVVAQIHTQLAPEAKLTPNHKILGQSGRWRQLDVTLEHTSGGYSMLIVIECKKYGRRVGISEVEAFSRKLVDIRGASRESIRGVMGVMISQGGFDAGAKSIARIDGIYLRNVVEAQETDWSALGFLNTFTFLGLKFEPQTCKMVLQDRDELITVDMDDVFIDIQSNRYTIRQAFVETSLSIDIQNPGPIAVRMDIPRMPIVHDGVSSFAIAFVGEGNVVARQFEIPIAIAQNKLMIDAHTGSTLHGQLTTVGIDWREIASQLRDEDGTLLTIDEYNNLVANERRLYPLNADTHKYVRLSVTYAPDPNQVS